MLNRSRSRLSTAASRRARRPPLPRRRHARALHLGHTHRAAFLHINPGHPDYLFTAPCSSFARTFVFGTLLQVPILSHPAPRIPGFIVSTTKQDRLDKILKTDCFFFNWRVFERASVVFIFIIYKLIRNFFHVFIFIINQPSSDFLFSKLLDWFISTLSLYIMNSA